MTKKLFWLWLMALVVINVIPIGISSNNSLNSSKALSFRLDYLIHSMMILVFALVWVWGKIHKVKWFARYEALKYCGIVLLAAVVLESLQTLVPWRSFNPVDLVYNLFGTGLVMVFVALSSWLTKPE